MLGTIYIGHFKYLITDRRQTVVFVLSVLYASGSIKHKAAFGIWQHILGFSHEVVMGSIDEETNDN